MRGMLGLVIVGLVLSTFPAATAVGPSSSVDMDQGIGTLRFNGDDHCWPQTVGLTLTWTDADAVTLSTIGTVQPCTGHILYDFTDCGPEDGAIVCTSVESPTPFVQPLITGNLTITDSGLIEMDAFWQKDNGLEHVTTVLEGNLVPAYRGPT